MPAFQAFAMILEAYRFAMAWRAAVPGGKLLEIFGGLLQEVGHSVRHFGAVGSETAHGIVQRS
jgi:hypothetical protein